MRLEMENVQGPVRKSELASAQVGKQKDVTGSNRLTKITHCTPTQIPTSELQIYLLEYQQCYLKKYMQEEYHHRG